MRSCFSWFRFFCWFFVCLVLLSPIINFVGVKIYIYISLISCLIFTFLDCIFTVVCKIYEEGKNK